MDQNQGSSCSSCQVTSCRDRQREGQSSDELMQGWAFSVASAATFLLPIILGILGSLSFPQTALSQLAGCIAGFGLGMLFALGINRILRPSLRNDRL